jgi:hypothetical protein
VGGAEFEAGEVIEELGAIAFQIVLGQIALVRPGGRAWSAIGPAAVRGTV